jgi:hypothetical protein
VVPLSVAAVVEYAPLRGERRPVVTSPRGSDEDDRQGWPLDRVSISSEAQEADAADAERAQDARKPAGQLDEKARLALPELQRRAARVREAALAPSDPSPQDLAVAASASAMEAAARAQQARKAAAAYGSP